MLEKYIQAKKWMTEKKLDINELHFSSDLSLRVCHFFVSSVFNDFSVLGNSDCSMFVIVKFYPF